MQSDRPALFRGWHFEDQIVVLCVRWYLRYSLSYRDLEEMMAERNLGVDHSTIACCVLRCWTLEVPLPSCRFDGPDSRLDALAQAGCDCGQTLLSIGSSARWSDLAAG